MSAFDEVGTQPIVQAISYAPRGITNPGSLCFLITLLQHLAQIEAFKTYFVDIAYHTDPSYDFVSKYDEVIRQLAKIIQHLGGVGGDSVRSPLQVTPLYKAIQRALRKDIDIDVPRDASEYFGELSKVLNLWYEQSSVQSHPVLSQKPPPLQLFQGCIHNVIEPKDDHTFDVKKYEPIIKVEKFYYLSLNISSGNLMDSFQQFQRAQFFPFKWKDPAQPQQYETQPRMTQKCSILHALPSVLMLHLNRFSYSTKYKVKLKLHDFFEFPLCFSFPLSDNNSVHEYELRGVLAHIGETAYTGHYVSYVFNNMSQSWWQCNDQDVQPVQSFEEEMKLLFGTPSSTGEEGESGDERNEESGSSSSSENSSDSDAEDDTDNKFDCGTPNLICTLITKNKIIIRIWTCGKPESRLVDEIIE